jgi:hypothetical protein
MATASLRLIRRFFLKKEAGTHRHPRQAVRLRHEAHEARRFERQTRRPGKQDGTIGRNGLAVLQGGALYLAAR